MHNDEHMPNTPLLTSAEVCGVLLIDRSTLSRWVMSGRLVPAMQAPGLRGARFFAPEDVHALRESLARAS